MKVEVVYLKKVEWFVVGRYGQYVDLGDAPTRQLSELIIYRIPDLEISKEPPKGFSRIVLASDVYAATRED